MWLKTSVAFFITLASPRTLCIHQLLNSLIPVLWYIVAVAKAVLPMQFLVACSEKVVWAFWVQDGICHIVQRHILLLSKLLL